MSSDAPLPPNPEEGITTQPGGLVAPETIPSVLPIHRRGWPLLAWLVILTVVGLILSAEHLRPAPAPGIAKQPARRNLMEELQLRYIVGANALTKERGMPQDFYSQSQSLKGGGVEQRLRFVILAGELKGPDEALAQLQQLENDKELTLEQQRLVDLLRRAYRDTKAPPLTEDERETLRQHLGWAGELALHPAGGADDEGRRELLTGAKITFAILFGAAAALLLVGLGGFVVFVLLATLALKGKLRSGLVGPSGTGGLYAEAFALWMALFFCASLAAAWLPSFSTGLRLGLAGVTQIACCLAALAWPMIWGVPWRQVREEIGLTLGKRPLLEVFLGFVTYISAFPLLVLAVVVIFLLMRLQAYVTGSEPMPPTHPIVEVLQRPTAWRVAQILLLASVVAPVVEETMFRGLLYRHLRETSPYYPAAGMRTARSILWSGVLTSFIFAVIHPQGFIGLPGLMALAFTFSLAREWRGSLISCMVAHSVNNGVATLLLTLLFSS
jgi:membrane protease YdiL (CAAX protease family)